MLFFFIRSWWSIHTQRFQLVADVQILWLILLTLLGKLLIYTKIKNKIINKNAVHTSVHVYTCIYVHTSVFDVFPYMFTHQSIMCICSLQYMHSHFSIWSICQSVCLYVYLSTKQVLPIATSLSLSCRGHYSAN